MTRTATRRAVRDLLIAQPQRSNRCVAREVGCSHPLVGRIRRLLESSGAVPIYRAQGGYGITEGHRVGLADDIDALAVGTLHVEVRCVARTKRGAIELCIPVPDMDASLVEDDPREFAQAIGRAALRWARARVES